MIRNLNNKLLKGHDIYSPFILRLYDHFVHQFSNKFIWKCPTEEIVALYNRNASGEHLDIGVGTGYFLRVTNFPNANPNITLLDANKNSLTMASKRLNHFRPNKVVANILEDLQLEERYTSASLCYILHCLSVDPKIKYQVFDRVSRVVLNGGRVFGATIVSDLKVPNLAASTLIYLYNKIGIFSNLDDTFDDVKIEFEKRFDDAHIQRIGSVVLFEGTVRK